MRLHNLQNQGQSRLLNGRMYGGNMANMNIHKNKKLLPRTRRGSVSDSDASDQDDDVRKPKQSKLFDR